MDILGILYSIISFVLWILWSIIWWFLSFLIVPLIILLVVLRFAYRSPYFRPVIDRYLAKAGESGKGWAKQALRAVTVTPLRVMWRLIWLSLLHAFISLFWKPKWDPVKRAWRLPKRSRDN